MNQLLVFGIFLLVLTVSEVQSNAAGPPINGINHDIVCNQFRVWHDGTYPMAGNGGYIIITNIPRYSSVGYNYTAGQIYTGKPSTTYVPDVVYMYSFIVWPIL